MAKGIYRVDRRCSVSHQTHNFLAFSFAPFLSVYVGRQDSPVLCSVTLSCSYMSGVGVTVTLQGDWRKQVLAASRQCLLKLRHLGTKCTLIFTQLDWYNLGYGTHLVALTCVFVGTSGVSLAARPAFDVSCSVIVYPWCFSCMNHLVCCSNIPHSSLCTN